MLFTEDAESQSQFARNDTKSVFHDNFRKKTFSDVCDECAGARRTRGRGNRHDAAVHNGLRLVSRRAHWFSLW